MIRVLAVVVAALCLAACGDAIVWAGMEQCDDGNMVNTDMCVAGCKTATCGDGFTQMGVETCDDGNVANNDGCSATCQVEVSKCGNGVIDPGERSKLKEESKARILELQGKQKKA